MSVTDGVHGAVEDAIARLHVAPAESVVLDFDSLTFGEVCDIEDAVGVETASTLLSGRPSPKAIVAAVWIVKRRTEPELSFDAVKAMRVADVEFS